MLKIRGLCGTENMVRIHVISRRMSAKFGELQFKECCKRRNKQRKPESKRYNAFEPCCSVRSLDQIIYINGKPGCFPPRYKSQKHMLTRSPWWSVHLLQLYKLQDLTINSAKWANGSKMRMVITGLRITNEGPWKPWPEWFCLCQDCRMAGLDFSEWKYSSVIGCLPSMLKDLRIWVIFNTLLL